MVGVQRTVGSLMVKSPIMVEPWQPVAHARQLMLMHSFSFLPVRHEEEWWLLSELGLAKFLNVSQTRRKGLLGLTIEEARKESPCLALTPVGESRLLTAEANVDKLLQGADAINAPMLWLVMDGYRKDHLAGVLSPFELM